MVLTFGREPDLGALLQQLVHLNYDAIAAYDDAIERLSDHELRIALASFRADHGRHIEALRPFIRSRGDTVPAAGAERRLLQEGRVKLAAVLGDAAILCAMSSNEVATEAAYRRAWARDDVEGGLARAMRASLADEYRHKAWMQARF